MLTVLIAEKDKKQLDSVLGAVNWGIYGFEVTGQFCDGSAALDAALRTQPDLMLVSEELPGVGGIDMIESLRRQGCRQSCVVLGGGESFETARRAMRAGVEDYLTRPLGRAELVRVLKKYAQRSLGASCSDINETFLQTRRRLRDSFMESLIAHTAPEYYYIDQLNSRYHFMFHDGVFQSATIVLRGLPGEENGEILETITGDVRARFDGDCYELIPYLQGPCRVSFTFNYGEDSGVGDSIEELYEIVRSRLEKCGCEDAVFCVGVGQPETEPSKLRKTLETAERAVRCGILRGQNKIYFYGKLKFDRISIGEILTPTLQGDLKRSAHALDIKGFERAVRSAFAQISFATDPEVLIQISAAAVGAVVEVFKADDDASSVPEGREILDRLGSETTLQDTIIEIVSWAQGLFSRRLKESKYAPPVREAVRYIQSHCTQQLTLEKVASQVHLNASYFCTMFKRETGQNFSDYLVSCRIKEAKRLLRESNLRISQVCTAVGYTDNKHFSQIFTKIVGIKPSAYRGLHG